MKQATKLIHAGETVDTGATPSLTTPIYETSTFVFDSVADVIKYQEGKLDGYLYSRYENPTVVAVEQKLAAIDGAETALLFSSGMAAIATAMFTLLKSGDEIVCSAAIYGGTFHIIDDLLSKVGITHRFVSLDDLANPASVIGPRTKSCGSSRRSIRRFAAWMFARWPQPARRPALFRRSTTPSRARSTSRCSRWASISRCRAARSS